MTLLALGGCTSSKPTETPVVRTVRLMPSQPTARAQLSAVKAPALQLQLTSIDNPRRQAFAVAAVLEVTVDGRTRQFELGAAAPFPADQPGVFVLPVPEFVQSTMAAANASVSVLLSLTSSSGGVLEAPLTVVVDVRACAQSDCRT